MIERRQAVRRQPIEVELEDGRVFTARPLSWMSSSDLGNEIVRQNAEVVNDMVRLYVEDGAPQLELKFNQKISDWQQVLLIAYPEEDGKQFTEPRALTIDECADLVIAALEVNRLMHLRHLVDPNFPAPTPTGGTISSETEPGILGLKTESLLNSL